MAGNVVSEFLISLGWDTKKLETGLSDVTNIINQGLKGAVMGISGAMVIGEVRNHMKAMTDELVQLNQISKTVEMSVESIEAWKNAVRSAGADGDSFGRVIEGVNNAMFQAINQGRGRLKRFVDQGILPALQDAEGNAKKTEDYLLEVSDALAKMDTRQASTVMKQVAGVSDIDTIEFLKQGSKAINDQIEAVKNHTHYTDQDVKMAKLLEAAQQRLAHTLKMAFLPVFRLLVEPMTKFADLCDMLAQHMQVLYPMIAGIAALMMAKLVPAIALATKAALGFLLSPWGALLALLLAIGIVLEDIDVWLEDGESEFGELYETIFGSKQAAVETFEELKEIWEDLCDSVKSVGSFIADALDIGDAGEVAREIVTAIATAFRDMKETLRDVKEMIRGIIIDVFGSEEAATQAIADILQIFKGLAGTAKDVFGTIAGGVLTVLKVAAPVVIELIATVLKGFASLKEGLLENFGLISNAVTMTADLFTNLLCGAIDKIGPIASGALDILFGCLDKVLGMANKVLGAFQSIGKVLQRVLGLSNDIDVDATVAAAERANNIKTDNSRREAHVTNNFYNTDPKTVTGATQEGVTIAMQPEGDR